MFNVVFDHGGRRVITGSDDRLVKVWSVESGLLLFTCAGAQDAITQIEVNCDDSLVAAGSLDGYIRVWRLADGAPTAVLKGAPGRAHAIVDSDCAALLRRRRRASSSGRAVTIGCPLMRATPVLGRRAHAGGD